MDTSWSNFLFQTPPTQSQPEAPLQSELLPELADPTQSPPAEHIVTPPSTVDTAALSEEPLPVKPITKPSRPAHICATCNKEFKNSYNLRRHQSVHTGIKMKDRAAREKEDGGKGPRVEKQTVPLSLLHLTLPPQPAPPPPSSPRPPGDPPPAGAARQPGQPAGVRVHRPSNRNHGSATSTYPSSCGGGGVHGAEPRPHPHRQPGEEEPRLRGLWKGLQGRVPPQPPPAVPLGREAVLLPHLPAALQEERSHELPRPLAPGRCGETLRLSALRQGLLQVQTSAWRLRWTRTRLWSDCVQVTGVCWCDWVCLCLGFRPDHLNSHVRQVHSTERPFKCTTCTSAFATRDRLRAHLIRHEEKVPCHICGKLLSAAYITDHMRVHNQSQHHACHLCNRSFTTLTYLRVHAQKHHGQEWKESGGARGGFGGTGAGGVLLCQLCGVQCKTATQLQGHMGTHANQGDPGPDPTSTVPVGTTSVAVTVSSASTVGLLVTDCSSIAPQPHS
uniref:Si:ch211-166g5.4 n=1 Tax=Sphaeramia orbicularis TaxID=375764 RepID=A0A672YQ29_9TELE